jgi:hypothetical protein
VPAAAQHRIASLEKRIVQRSLLMRAASFDAPEAFADPKHQNSRVADARLRRKFGGVRVKTFENLPFRADARL